jgi:hypothetical protein
VDVSINRWAGRGVIGQNRPVEEAAWTKTVQVDRLACGVDRELLLRQIAGEPESRVATERDAFALVRPGRRAWHLGPVIANDSNAAERLLDQLIGDAKQSPTADVIVDVVEGSAMEGLLSRRGFAIARRLKRMRRPAADDKLLWSERVYAASGFELG